MSVQYVESHRIMAPNMRLKPVNLTVKATNWSDKLFCKSQAIIFWYIVYTGTEILLTFFNWLIVNLSQRNRDFKAVLRIRIHMFLGLPDPDPLVRGMDLDPDLAPDPDPSIIMQNNY